MCNKLVVKIHLIGGLKRLNYLLKKKTGKSWPCRGGKMRCYDENTENLGTMTGTMKHVGAFTGTHAPPHVLVGKGLCWRVKAHAPGGSKQKDRNQGRKKDRKEASKIGRKKERKKER